MPLTYPEALAALDAGARRDPDALLEAFLAVQADRGLELYPAQEEAILELFAGKNVILNTPTGSGKSLVAAALQFQAFAAGRRSVYTCPVKALVNEKWMALCRDFGPENVGLSTGDASVNRDAPLLCCTAEILANIALSEGAAAPVGDVVMDEFHYYSDRERGVAWQVPLLCLANTRFLLMSATLGDTAFFEKELTRLNGRETVSVRSATRPVPLDFSWSEDGLPDAVQKLAREGKAPVYVVHFTQMDATRNAQAFTSLDLCDKEEKAALAEALQGFRFSSPFGADMKRWLRQGIGLHHAGLLPKYRVLVERLSQKGLLKVICGTDTLGVGVNVPIRTVLFTQLCKYSGDKTALLSARDFHQISGRAGRKGFDDRGYVVAQAPEHVIENRKLEAKSQRTGKKVVKRKPPDRGYVPWDEPIYRRLITAEPERLVSRFQVSHAMVLNVLSRPGDGCRDLRALLAACHDAEAEKARHRKRAFQLFRTLAERNIITLRPEGAAGPKLRVNVALQEDFGMHQELSLWLLDALPSLDAASEEYAADLLTLVESILENPDLILRKQLDKLKGERLAQLKNEGVEYEQRMAELEDMEYPKPLREFVYASFNAFTEKHPWLSNANIRPKSVAREMLEGFHTFSGYVKAYGLERSEGLLLRHLNAVYKVLQHTVPDAAKTEPVREMEAYFGELLRRVDSSLLEEWEKLRNPDFIAEAAEENRPPGAEAALADVTRDEKAFLALIRARLFEFLAAVARGDAGEALEALEEGEGEAAPSAVGVPVWTSAALAEAWERYREEHGSFRLDPEGRAPRHTHLQRDADGKTWSVTHMLQDDRDMHDGAVTVAVDLEASRRAGSPVLRLVRFGDAEGFPDGP